MRFLKSLLGGILGSAIGVAAYFAINQYLPGPKTWAVLIIGLLAGLGVRVFCGRNRSPLTGIVAATTALIALLGFNYSVIALAQQASDPIISEHVEFDKDGRPIAAAEDEEESEASEESQQEPEPEPVAVAPATLSEGKTIQVADVFSQPNLAMVQSSPMDMIALAMTGLLAFVLGRGTPTLHPSSEPIAKTAAESDEQVD